jgi:zinc protease
MGGFTPETLIAEIDEEIVRLQTELISEKEFQKLQNIFESQYVEQQCFCGRYCG